MGFRQAVRRNRVSGRMFANTFSTGERAAPEGEALRQAQLTQERNMLYLSIRDVFRQRHRMGLSTARGILRERVADYRQLSQGRLN